MTNEEEILRPYDDLPEWYKGEILLASPILQECIKDERWAQKQITAGKLKEYEGSFVFILNRQVIGYSKTMYPLWDELSEKYQVPPGRIAAVYVGSYEW